MNGHPTSAQHICVMPSIESKVAYSSNYTCVVKDKALLGRGNSWYIGTINVLPFADYKMSCRDFRNNDWIWKLHCLCKFISVG